MRGNLIKVGPLDVISSGYPVGISIFKPHSHRKIVKDIRSTTGKDQEILSESG